MLATAGVKGFAFTLGIGTIVSLFTAVLATSGGARRDGALAPPALASTRSAWATGAPLLAPLRLHGELEVVLLDVGRILVAARSRSRARHQLRHRLRVRHAHHDAAEKPASVDQVRDALAPLGYGDAKIQKVKDPELGKNVIQISTAQLEPARSRSPSRRSTSDFGVRGDFSSELDRADVRRPDRANGGHRARRIADPDLALHRASVRVEVLRAGPDRVVARPPDHGRRLRPHAAGGDDLDGRRPAHDLGLLAVRHDHRVRPNTRERAAHAARDLLADRRTARWRR